MADADPDRRDLAVLYPNTGQSPASRRRYAGFGQGFDEQIFKPAQVPMQILPAVAQVDDRIAHQLPRAVIGSLAAAVNRKQRIGKMRSATQTGLVRRAADRVDRIVFDQEQLVA